MSKSRKFHDSTEAVHMYSHFSFKSIALTVLDLEVVLFLSNDSVRPLQNKEIARVGRCRFYTPTCRWHVGSLSVRRSSEIIVNVFFGSLVLQASEQQIGVF